jgi:transposase
VLSVDAGQRIWLCTQPTDMRRSFDGLSAMVRNHLNEDPTTGEWFAFINRKRLAIYSLTRVAIGSDDLLCFVSSGGDRGHTSTGQTRAQSTTLV